MTPTPPQMYEGAGDGPGPVQTLAEPTREGTPERKRRWFHWFLSEPRLSSARAAVHVVSAEEAELRRRAKLAREAADRTLFPVESFRSGDGAALAANLYRQALYWALLSWSPTAGSPSERELWVGSRDALSVAGLDPDQMADLEAFFTGERVFVQVESVTLERQRASALLARHVLSRILEQRDGPVETVQQLKGQRVLRLSLIPIVLVAIAVGIVAMIPEKPDLARKKPWRASSSFAKCDPEAGECGGARTTILFHTLEENSPWFEIDLGAPLKFSSMTIRNRSDGEAARAAPLIVEISGDQTNFLEVVRRDKTFSVWKPSFAPKIARYVRLRVPRRTYFHLEEVKVHP